jgi:hypothetical protein
MDSQYWWFLMYRQVCKKQEGNYETGNFKPISGSEGRKNRNSFDS